MALGFFKSVASSDIFVEHYDEISHNGIIAVGGVHELDFDY